MRFGDHEVLGSGDLGHVEIFGQKGGKNLLLSRTFGQRSDLLQVLGTVFVDLGAVATGDLHGRHQKGPRPSGTGGATPASARPKGHHSEGRKLKPHVKSYEKLPDFTRNYEKLPEITRSGRILERENLPLMRPSGKSHFFWCPCDGPGRRRAGDLEIMRS
mgnify:CR=1 FL=1